MAAIFEFSLDNQSNIFATTYICNKEWLATNHHFWKRRLYHLHYTILMSNQNIKKKDRNLKQKNNSLNL